MAGMKSRLTRNSLLREAAAFAAKESKHREKTIYGVTDGKAVGTYFEHKFQRYLRRRFDYSPGSSAKGIDFPDLDIDMKVTSIRQPHSSAAIVLPVQVSSAEDLRFGIFPTRFRVSEDRRPAN